MNLAPPLRSNPTSLPSCTATRRGAPLRKYPCSETKDSNGEEQRRYERNRAGIVSLRTSPASSEIRSHLEVPHIVKEVLRTPGQPLDPATRALMEPRFGHEFSKVRVHTDPKAAESVRAVNALAYTVGGDVVFAAGHFAPSTPLGRGLLAHELTHVLQQAAGGNKEQILARLELGEVSDRYELEAEQMADAVESEVPAALEESGPAVKQVVQRAPAGTRQRSTEPSAVSDDVVQSYIDAALRRANQNVKKAVIDLNAKRQSNCDDLNLAAAEHYMFARYLTYGELLGYVPVAVLVLGYALSKLLRLRFRTGSCPTTATSAAQVKWGLRGAADGALQGNEEEGEIEEAQRRPGPFPAPPPAPQL